MPPSVAVVGSINVDLVARCHRLPEPGETVSAEGAEYVPGGKGANQAVAAARLGATVRMVGCVGSDRLATLAQQGMRDARVEVEWVTHVGCSDTGLALIVVDDAGENQIVVIPGANASLDRHDPEHADVGTFDAILCQLEVPDEPLAAAARLATGLFCLNAAPARPVPAEVLGRADLVVVNRHELDALAETPHLVALTLGAEGAVLLEDGEEVARAAPPEVDAVDGTAAGDSFTACLVVSLLEGRDREEALRRACAAGAIAASRAGAQPSLPTAAEVDEILRG
ncbi:MAG TPA: ribokinase [Gaiellaceae bacterium]|nr:ribokinase [Gaiellaceae bacterium]